jgi:DNA-directed RNA polymerase specialized sigma24 family protein
VSTLQIELTRLQSGEQSFERFARATRKTWLNLAHHLLRRWRGPVSVDVEDLVQELLVACWRCLLRFDPSRVDGKGNAISIERYVVYNSVDKAKKWLHKRRGAYRRDDKSPSRFELPFSTLGGQHEWDEIGDGFQARLIDQLGSVAATQDSELVRRQSIASLPSQDLAFMFYQRCPDIERAAQAITQNPLARLALRAPNLSAARAVVERSIELAAAGAA